MIIISFIVLFNFAIQPSFYDETVERTLSYIKEIEKGINPVENYWALSEIYSSTCLVNNNVYSVIQKSEIEKLKNYFLIFPCGENSAENEKNRVQRIYQIAYDKGYESLLIYYLLNSYDKDYILKDAYEGYIEKWKGKYKTEQLKILSDIFANKPLGDENLPFTNKELIYFSMLYSNKKSASFSQYFSSGDQNDLFQFWTTSFPSYKKESIVSAIFLANFFRLSYNLNQYAKISELIDSILSNELFPVSDNLLKIYMGINYSLFVIGRYDQSLNIERTFSIPLSQFLQNEDITAKLLMLEGVNLYSLGKYKESLSVYDSDLLRQNSSTSLTVLLNNISLNYKKLGYKNKYISYQLEALIEADKEHDYKNILGVLRNLFIYHTEIGDYTTALHYINRAEIVASENNDLYELASIHVAKGNFYWEAQSDDIKALSELVTAEKKLNFKDYYFDYINLLIVRSNIYNSLEEYDEAISTLERIKELALSNSDTRNYLEALINLSEIALKQNDLEKATTLLDEIKTYSLDIMDFEILVNYYTSKAKLLFLEGKSREAYSELRPVIDQIIAWAHNSTDSQTGFWNIEDEYIEAFDLICSILIDNGSSHEIVFLLDQLKTINDASLYNNLLLKGSKLSEKDIADDRLLNSQILALRSKYLTASKTEKLNIRSKIDHLSAQKEEITNKLGTSHFNENIPVWSVQRQLETDELIIHIAQVGKSLFISYITNFSIYVDNIELSSDIENLLKTESDNLSSSHTNLENLYEIYSALGLENHIPKEINYISVIPDNYFYRIPLDILPTKPPHSKVGYGTSRYLIEDYHFQYFTSLEEFVKNKRSVTSKAQTDFSAFAISDFSFIPDHNLPSLPFATQEITSIDKSLTTLSHKNIFIDNAATKKAFKNNLSSSRIVHVATHSEVSEQDPLFSTIYFKRDTTASLDETSMFYAYELFDTQLDNDFIMLNSCSSGSGNYLQGSGIMGITRALRYAGAKSLALNLWSVNDKKASEFATEFYKNINKGLTKPDAIREAKLHLLANGNANPHYWGAYMLIGNPSPLSKKPVNTGFLYSFLLSAILLISISLKRKSKY